MYYDHDHRLVIKILKVKVADGLSNANGQKSHYSLIRNGFNVVSGTAARSVAYSVE